MLVCHKRTQVAATIPAHSTTQLPRQENIMFFSPPRGRGQKRKRRAHSGERYTQPRDQHHNRRKTQRKTKNANTRKHKTAGLAEIAGSSPEEAIFAPDARSLGHATKGPHMCLVLLRRYVFEWFAALSRSTPSEGRGGEQRGGGRASKGRRKKAEEGRKGRKDKPNHKKHIKVHRKILE